MVFCLTAGAASRLRIPARQVQAADAGVVAFQVFPEPAGQGRGKLSQAAVIQCGLPLLQVVHQQVTDWPAGQVVTVDQLTGSALARSCQLPQHRRCRGLEDPHPVEHPVEPRSVRHRLSMRAGLGVQQLDDVAHGDLPEQAALGADDDGAAVQTCARAWAETCGSRSHSSRSRVNPSASLVACMPRLRWPPRITAPANQLVLGRTASAQITVSRAADNRPSRAPGCWPRP